MYKCLKQQGKLGGDVNVNTAMLGTLNQHGLNQSVSNAHILDATPCNLKFPCKCVLCHFQFFHWPCVQVRLCYSLGQVDASCLKSEPVCRSELTDFIENRAVYDGHNMTSSSGKTSNVWHFEPILEHVFIRKNTCVSVRVCVQKDLKVCNVILSRLMIDAQFLSSATIYKFSKYCIWCLVFRCKTLCSKKSFENQTSLDIFS